MSPYVEDCNFFLPLRACIPRLAGTGGVFISGDNDTHASADKDNPSFACCDFTSSVVLSVCSHLSCTLQFSFYFPITASLVFPMAASFVLPHGSIPRAFLWQHPLFLPSWHLLCSPAMAFFMFSHCSFPPAFLWQHSLCFL